MDSDLYMIIADIMRYVFLLMIAVILLRLFILSLREWRTGAVTKRKRRTVQMGYITVTKPAQLANTNYRLYRETTVGKARSCDISIPVRSLKRRHAIIFERGGDMYITACYPAKYGVELNGTSIGRGDGRLSDGDRVTMEGVTFRVHLGEAEETDEETYGSYDAGTFDDE